MTEVQTAKRIAEDFQAFEAHEMPLFAYDRDVELVRHALRCLAYPGNGWSGDVLAALTTAHAKGGRDV